MGSLVDRKTHEKSDLIRSIIVFMNESITFTREKDVRKKVEDYLESKGWRLRGRVKIRGRYPDIIGIKDNKIDAKFIVNNRLIQEHVLKQMKVENVFTKTLNNKVKEFNEKEGLSILTGDMGNVKEIGLDILKKMLSNPRNIPKYLKSMRKAIK